MKARENMQNRVQPPKTSPIEQITDRCEPKISPLRRVTLQCLTSCYRWSNLLRDNVSNLALASAQNPPKIWKYAWKILIFLLWFLTFWPPSDIVGVHAIGSKSWGCFCTLLKLGNCIKSHKHGRFQREERSFGALIMRNFQVWVKGSGTNERAFSSACIAPFFAHIPENKPKTSPIEQIRYRWEPKISNL